MVVATLMDVAARKGIPAALTGIATKDGRPGTAPWANRRKSSSTPMVRGGELRVLLPTDRLKCVSGTIRSCFKTEFACCSRSGRRGMFGSPNANIDIGEVSPPFGKTAFTISVDGSVVAEHPET